MLICLFFATMFYVFVFSDQTTRKFIHQPKSPRSQGSEYLLPFLKILFYILWSINFKKKQTKKTFIALNAADVFMRLLYIMVL